MDARLSRFLLAVLAVASWDLGQALADSPPAKIGNIIIVGNERTQDRVIRQAINLYPGQALNYADLRAAEQRLVRRGIFNTDSKHGIPPTITVLESDSEYKDILVQVQEQPTGRLLFGVGFNTEGQMTFSMILEEQNFDPLRLPTSMADVREGRAFRGGGKKLHVDVFRITAPGGLTLMRWQLQ